ncbi:hypothetical protein EBS02_06365 [bacterium]|nr:hypothetical protein [bacterium]NBX71924.1 hypothetical protein [bacterium]
MENNIATTPRVFRTPAECPGAPLRIAVLRFSTPPRRSTIIPAVCPDAPRRNKRTTPHNKRKRGINLFPQM